ncbi:MAG: hypothetical protein HWE27_03025 [Gammaproteobacteria bacterium]|nr:hypothetical protein [Gammaproteobacteria bacterium]
MTANKFSFRVIISSLLALMILSGCSIHGHSGYHGRHSGVHVSGHVHGGSRVAGAIVAGAIIGGIVTAAHQNAKQKDIDETYEKKAMNAQPTGPHYYKDPAGRCFWVVPREDGSETRELIEDKYCSDN